MADEPQDATAAETKPTPRRRGPNKPKPEGAAKPGRKPRAVTAAVEGATAAVGKAEEAVVEAAKKPAAAVTGAAKSAVKAVKPRAAKRGTPPPAKSKPRGTAKSSRGWGSLTIAGGLAAAGAAATAAVLALRSSAAKSGAKLPPVRTGSGSQPSSPPNAKGPAHEVGGDTTTPVTAGTGEPASTPGEA